jgi:hypothetical protein
MSLHFCLNRPACGASPWKCFHSNKYSCWSLFTHASRRKLSRTLNPFANLWSFSGHIARISKGGSKNGCDMVFVGPFHRTSIDYSRMVMPSRGATFLAYFIPYSYVSCLQTETSSQIAVYRFVSRKYRGLRDGLFWTISDSDYLVNV